MFTGYKLNPGIIFFCDHAYTQAVINSMGICLYYRYKVVNQIESINICHELQVKENVS